MAGTRYWIYITASARRTLYVGYTDDIVGRIEVHRRGRRRGFAWQAAGDRLVYVEELPDIDAATHRVRQVRWWGRSRKEALIASVNPDWEDLWESPAMQRLRKERPRE